MVGVEQLVGEQQQHNLDTEAAAVHVVAREDIWVRWAGRGVSGGGRGGETEGRWTVSGGKGREQAGLDRALLAFSFLLYRYC